MGVDISNMREVVKNAYPGTDWSDRVKNMSDHQVMAIYFCLMKKEMKKYYISTGRHNGKQYISEQTAWYMNNMDKDKEHLWKGDWDRLVPRTISRSYALEQVSQFEGKNPFMPTPKGFCKPEYFEQYYGHSPYSLVDNFKAEYTTCKGCGANLDIDERCTCSRGLRKHIICYDDAMCEKEN